MIDITKEVNNYCECVRNLWNVHFLSKLTNENHFDLMDEFDEISALIFSSLILNRIECESYKKSKSNQSELLSLDFLIVTPSNESGIPVHINREKGTSAQSYWDHPVNFIKPGDIDMRFIDFYDFNQHGFRGFEFIIANIKESPSNEDLKTRNALVKTNYVNILFDDNMIDD